jgi:hypothetical protein
MSNSYYRWATPDDLTLFVQLVSPTGQGVPGMTPEVAIRRIRATHGGPLDGYFWNGATFQNTPVWLPMSELDAANCPGLYTYLFGQSAIGAETVYLVYYRHTVAPVGFAVEEHLVTNELFIPQGSPVVPVLPGDTVMGRLVAMEDPTKPVALANADAVWDEMLAQHLNPGSTGEALARLAAGLVGAWQIEINVQDTTPAPIQGVRIDIFDNTNTNFLGRVYTDLNGKVNVALDTGAYALRMFKSGYSFTVPEVLTVTADGSVTYTGTSLIIIVPPSDPNLCAIYGTVRNAAGKPVPNARVTVYASTPQIVQGTQQHIEIACTLTDGNGFFRVELERLAKVNFAIEDTGLDVERTVPDAPTQDLATWT